MCLSTVYLRGQGEETLVARDVSSLSVGQGQVVCTDILGAQVTVPGQVQEVDLVNNLIWLESGK